MKSNYESVSDCRKLKKQMMVESMGGGCAICGYNKSNRALDFHHIHPSEKDSNIGHLLIKSWDFIVQELQKCVLLCNRCHQEIHDGVTELPVDVPKFNVEYTDFRGKKIFDNCPICGWKKYKRDKFCSTKCYNLSRKRVDLPTKDELIRLLTEYNFSKVAKMFNVSDNAIRKWCKSYDISHKSKDYKCAPLV